MATNKIGNMPDKMTVAEASSIANGLTKQFRAFNRLAEVLDVAASAERAEGIAKSSIDALRKKVEEAEAESTIAVDNFKKATAAAATKYKKEIERRKGELAKLSDQATEAQAKVVDFENRYTKELAAASAGHQTEVTARKQEITDLDAKKQQIEKDIDKLRKKIAG